MMVSIIIPVYNVADYIKECLDSIINQSYKDYQIIIVDDGSTDNSLKIIDSYKDKFNNLEILTQRNKGVSEARNLALRHVKGEYVLYVDPDDFLEKDMLKLMIKSMEQNKSDIVISGYSLYYNKEDTKNRNVIYGKINNESYSSDEVIDMMLQYKLEGQLWNKLFKTELLRENNFYFEPGRYIQDVYPVFKIINKCNSISFIDKPLYYYRQRETSTVHKKNQKLTEDYYYAMSSIMKYIKSNNINFNENSYKIFRLTVLSRFIAYYTNAKEKRIYKDFKNSHYKMLDVRLSDIIFTNNIDVNIKKRDILWKVRLFPMIKRIKNMILN